MIPSRHFVPATDEARELQPVLCALAGELAGAAALALGLQETLVTVITASREPPAAVYELQALDRLTQTLDDLARFIEAIARDVPETWHVEATQAAAAVHQRDLAQRLLEPGAVELEPAWEEDDFLLGNS